MSSRILVLGAGMGGLAAALRLARRGADVTVIESRAATGGLASGVEAGGLSFDGGPYVLLDRPGLNWVFEELGLDVEGLGLQIVERFYQVAGSEGPPVRVDHSLETTAAAFDAQWPGSGARYRTFVAAMETSRRRLAPLLRRASPAALDVLAAGAWRDVPLLLRSLGSVLEASRLPRHVQDALSVWTHVAGQSVREAPSPMAFVPALIHGAGPHVPHGGMRAIPACLETAARQAGVGFRLSCRVTAIRRATGGGIDVVLEGGETLHGDAVISGVGGLSTCLELVDATPRATRREIASWPLQSPGACVYLAVRAVSDGPMLRFHVGRDGGARLLVLPREEGGQWRPARLIVPLAHSLVETLSETGQSELVARYIDEPWWTAQVSDARVLSIRRPCDWRTEFGLHRGAMNPVMTARLMRRGRLPHRLPEMPGLYLCGSATHPGQWVSFCAISGILAADMALQDLSRC